MVEVKFSLIKRDFVWIGLLVVLVGVSFTYGYGGSNPVVMGHSGAEIEIDDVFCTRISGHACGYDNDGAGANDLVNGVHSSGECTGLGGEVVDAGGNSVCRFNQTGCPTAWLQYRDWFTTTSRTYSNTGDFGNNDCGYSRYRDCWTSCATGGHSWSDSVVEYCEDYIPCVVYPYGQDVRLCETGGYAVVAQIGCY